MPSLQFLPAVAASLVLAACLDDGSPSKSVATTRNPLDSLLGYYSGIVEKTTCTEPNIPAADSCGSMRTDTLPVQYALLSRLSDSSLALFLPGLAAFTVTPGDTVLVGSGDTIGAVSCFRIPDQTIEPSGATHPEADYEQAEAGEICRDSAGFLSSFTVRAKNDPRLLVGDRHLYRGMRRVPPPPPD